MIEDEMSEIFDSLRRLSESLLFMGTETQELGKRVREFVSRKELEHDIRELERAVGKLEDCRDKADR